MASRTLISQVKHTKLFYNIYFYVGSYLIKIIKIFVKPDDKLIFFSSFSGKAFDDSPRALYEGMLNDPRFDDYELAWDFRNPERYDLKRGVKIKTDTLDYYIKLLKARLWITNVSMNRGLDFSGKHSFVFNTWHGSAIKKIGVDVKEGGGSFKSKSKQKKGDVMLAQGVYDVKTFSRAYELQENEVIPIGLPRNDELVYNNKEDIITSLKNKIGIPQNKKVIFYAPTYRDFIKDDNKNSIFDMPFHVEKWEEKMGEDYILLFRAHPDIAKVLNIVENGFVKDVSSYPHVNELMLVSDLLISDYSSIFFDYSILERPMLCFCYDYDRYKVERGVYFDIRKELKCENLMEEENLINEISKLDWGERKNITIAFRNKYIESYGDATQKSLDFLYKVLNS